MTNFIKVIADLLGNDKFINGLRKVGGQKRYHQEPDALVHSALVAAEAVKIWGPNTLMVLVAWLHDLGKITAHVQKPNGDFSYPDHARVGGELLKEFISEELPQFTVIQWYIINHIRPLHWAGCDYSREEAMESLSNHSNLQVTNDMFDNLVRLSICDVLGAIPEDKDQQERTVKYLESLLKRPIPLLPAL